MDRNEYIVPTAEIIAFSAADIITSSDGAILLPEIPLE